MRPLLKILSATLMMPIKQNKTGFRESQAESQNQQGWGSLLSRIEFLERQNAELLHQLEILQSDARSSTEEDTKLEKKLLDEHGKHAPRLVIHDFSTETEEAAYVPHEYYTQLAGRYNDLFQENTNLIQAFCTAKRRLRDCKGKIALWNRYFERDIFDVFVSGKKVTFQRTSPSKGSRVRQRYSIKRRQGTIARTVPSTRRRFGSEIERMLLPGYKTVGDWPPLKGRAREGSQILPPILPHGLRIRTGLEKATRGEHPVAEQSAHSFPQPQDSQCVDDSLQPDESTSNALLVVSAKPVETRHPENRLINPTTPCHSYLEIGSFIRPVIVGGEPSSGSCLRNATILDEHDHFDRPNPEDTFNSTYNPKTQCNLTHIVEKGTNFQIFDGGRRIDCRRLAAHNDRLLSCECQASQEKPCSVIQPVDSNTEPKRFNEAISRHSTKRRRIDDNGVEAIPTIPENGDNEICPKLRSTRSLDEAQPAATVKSIPSSSENLPIHKRLATPLEGLSSPRPILAPLSCLRSLSAKMNPGEASSTGTPELNPSRGNKDCSSLFITAVGVDRYSASDQRVIQLSPPVSNSRLEKHSHPDRFTAADGCDDVNNDMWREEPYRARPAHQLELEHFKLNPERNQGLDYAFGEVVRKRDLRKCLPGCTRLHCCGSEFRAMAKIGGSEIRSGKGIVPLEALDQEGRRILDDYLGNSKDILRTMSDKELQELLLEVGTRQLANRFGRHRYIHGRARSPPGFWRADMPSTQEAELDRQEAQNIEREKVRERYWEAMSPRGIWSFADE